MNVDEDRRGLRVINVFDGSPAKRAGIKKGEFITEVNGKLDRRPVQRRGHRPHQGPGRAPSVRARGRRPRRGRAAHAARCARARIEVPVAEGKIERARRQEARAWSSSPPSATARTACCARRSTRLRTQGADGHRARPARQRRRAAARGRAGVLDLHRGRPDHLHQGPHQAQARVRGRGRGDPRGHPGGGARGPRQRLGVGDRHRRAARPQARHRGRHSARSARACSRRCEPLSNGGVLDITVGEYFLPSGENIGKKGVRPTVRATDDPDTDRDEALPIALKTLAGETADERPGAGAPGAARLPDGRRAGQARPLPGGRAAVRAARLARGAGRRAAARRATSCWWARASAARGCVRTLGRPDVARDVVEALMLDRGLRRSFPRRVEDEAADAERRADDARARRPARPAHVHDRPRRRRATSTTPISAERRTTARSGCGCTSPTCRAYVRPGGAIDTEAYRRGTSVYVPGAVEPMLPEALSNRACSLRPGEDKLAVTVEMDMAGTDVRRVRVPPLADPQRRPADLRRGRRGVRRRARAPRSPGASRWPPRARWPPRCASGASERGALEVELDASRTFDVRRRRPRDRRAPRGADRVPHADRGADDPRQRAGGRLPGRPQAAHALPRAREARPAGGRAHGGPAGLARHPHAGAARAT